MTYQQRPPVADYERQYRDKLDPQYIFNNQVLRCLLSIDTEYFPNNVEALSHLLPTASYANMTARRKEWTPIIEEFEYTYSGPIRLGTPTKPIMQKIGFSSKRYPIPYVEDEDGNREIDWSDPHIVSPKLVSREYPDYKLFFKLIWQEAEEIGLTWKTEPLNSEYGLYPEAEEEEIKPNPLDDPKKNEPQEPVSSRKPRWIFYKGIPKRVTNYLGYACGVGPGEKPWFFSEIRHRQKKQKPIVGMITATQGEGKTYCAIRLAEILDKKFDPDKQIVMDRRKILKLVSGRGGLKRDQVIIIDESQWGASAREWGKKEQIKLMKFLAAARFKGFIIFIVSLHRSMLDSIIRERIINFHIHMEERGRATIYQTRHPRFDEVNYPTRVGGLLLQLPDYDQCSAPTCLDCKKDKTCKTLRARYERNKTTFIETEADKDAREEESQAAAEMGDKEIALLLVGHTDKINTTAKGFYDISDIQYALAENLGLEVSIKKATRIRSHLMRISPPNS